MHYVSTLLSTAEHEIGYLEKKSNSQLDDKTANAGFNNWTKYGRDLQNMIGEPYVNGVAWCDMFVDWCFVQAFGIADAEQLIHGWSAYCPTSASYYKAHKAFFNSPKPGDQIFFKNTQNIICHTGIVSAVDDKYVYTIEGNTSSTEGVIANGGGVFEKKYLKTYKYIAGYGRPDYDEEYGWIKNSVGWWYKEKDGTYPTSCWKLIDDKYYYFKEDGYLAINEYIKAKDYTSSQKLYYVNSSGEWDNKSYRWMYDNIGWWLAEIGGNWYAQNEWEKIDGDWYYFTDDGYMVQSRLKVIDGKTYQFDSEGRLVNN